MMERKNLVTIRGEPLTLLGNPVKIGDAAPNFEVIANDLSVVSFSSLRGRTCIISSVPSLDTSVCDTMTQRFNEEAGNLGKDVAVLTISMDLPFAQKRWCGASGAANVQVFSDHRDASFGTAFGVLIKELRLLARAVFVIGGDNVVRYAQIVNELTHEPDYQTAVNAAKKLL